MFALRLQICHKFPFQICVSGWVIGYYVDDCCDGSGDDCGDIYGNDCGDIVTSTDDVTQQRLLPLAEPDPSHHDLPLLLLHLPSPWCHLINRM